MSPMAKQSEENEEVLQPQELDGEEEFPYLRRQKAVAVRRRRTPWSWRWLLFFTGVVSPLGIASYYLTAFALSSSHFELNSADDIQVFSNRFVTHEDVATALGLPLHPRSGRGLKVFRLSLEAGRKQIESIAWVRSAVLTRVFPNRLVVYITERTPVAYANLNGHVNLVDSEGVLLDKPESASFDFPVITGLNWKSRLRRVPDSHLALSGLHASTWRGNNQIRMVGFRSRPHGRGGSQGPARSRPRNPAGPFWGREFSGALSSLPDSTSRVAQIQHTDRLGGLALS